MNSITVKAPAKLNLTLTVTGRRPDGYHLLDSLFAFSGLHDVVSVSIDDALQPVMQSGPFAHQTGMPEHNLVMLAARLLQEQAGIGKGARIELIKNIPVAAGLGGGSADAAATLNALNRLWQLDWPTNRLEELAAQLGADIPACIRSKPVLVRGIGDELGESPELPDCGILLVNPMTSTPTPAVFKALRELRPTIATGKPLAFPGAFAGLPALVSALESRGNDLTPAAIAVSPSIAVVLEVLDGLSGARYAALSGSGATCFALFESQELAGAAQATLSNVQPQWWTWSGKWA